MNEAAMQSFALTIDRLFGHAARRHSDTVAVTGRAGGVNARIGYAWLSALARPGAASGTPEEVVRLPNLPAAATSTVDKTHPRSQYGRSDHDRHAGERLQRRRRKRDLT